MTLRDKTAVSDLLHGRWSERSIYVYLRLAGEGREDDGRIVQPVDLMEHDAQGRWLPIASDPPAEIRVFRRGLGDLEGPVLDHPGGTSTTVYRVGAKGKLERYRGKERMAYSFKVTDRIDTAQAVLPPTPTPGQPALGAPPAGGPNSQSLSQGCAQPTTPPAAAGPISPPAAAGPAPPSQVPAAAETAPLCPTCGARATRFHEMWVHCGQEVRA